MVPLSRLSYSPPTTPAVYGGLSKRWSWETVTVATFGIKRQSIESRGRTIKRSGRFRSRTSPGSISTLYQLNWKLYRIWKLWWNSETYSSYWFISSLWFCRPYRVTCRIHWPWAPIYISHCHFVRSSSWLHIHVTQVRQRVIKVKGCILHSTHSWHTTPC